MTFSLVIIDKERNSLAESEKSLEIVCCVGYGQLIPKYKTKLIANNVESRSTFIYTSVFMREGTLNPFCHYIPCQSERILIILH